jgi:hypothetical protein
LLGFVSNFVERLGVMACYLNPNVSFTTNNPLPTCAGYNRSPNVDNLQPLHEGGGLGNLNSIVIDEHNVDSMHLEGL